MAEIWKPVPSYPGLLASSEGRILLPPGYAPLPNGGYRVYLPEPFAGVQRRAKATASHVYLGCWVRKYGNIKVHQAVCEAFHGPKPFDKAVVIHKDEDALNNRPENLKWGTQKENLNMPKIKAYHRSRVGENATRTKWAANRNSGEEGAARCRPLPSNDIGIGWSWNTRSASAEPCANASTTSSTLTASG